MGNLNNPTRAEKLAEYLNHPVGAVDVSVLKLASGLAHMKPMVLSIDSALIAECRRAGVDA